MPPVKRAATSAQSFVNFGDLAFYSGGFVLPEGDYALEFSVQMFAGTKNDGTPAGPERLGVMLTAHPLNGGEPSHQFLSMGSKAHESYAPDAETGKRLVSVPGGPGAQPNNQTNWALLLKSMYDCGLPVGILTDDFTAIDGIHVHTQNVPEPEGRKGYGSSTGDVQEDQRKGPKLIPIVTEIKDDGKPWEGSGGLPEAGKPAAKVAPKVAGKITPKVAAKPVVEPEPEGAGEAVDAEDLFTLATNAMSAVFEKNPKGCPKLTLRTSVFKSITAAHDTVTANKVLKEYWTSDATLNELLGGMGYEVKGSDIVQQA